MITLEPGLYRHGLGGVRLEDLLLVTEDGAEVLTDFPYDLELLEPARRGEVVDVGRGGQTIDTLFLEDRRFPPPPSPRRRRTRTRDLRARLPRVLGGEGRERVTWFEPFTGSYEWNPPFRSGISAASSTSPTTASTGTSRTGRGNRVAYHWEGEPGRHARDLLRGAAARHRALGDALKELGVGGPPVAIYLGMIPELPVAMLACTRLGAPHTVVFGGFSAARSSTG